MFMIIDNSVSMSGHTMKDAHCNKKNRGFHVLKICMAVMDFDRILPDPWPASMSTSSIWLYVLFLLMAQLCFNT